MQILIRLSSLYWTLSDFGGATNDTRVFSETPVGLDFPAPAADGDSDDEVTIRKTSLIAPANPPIVSPPAHFDFAGSNKNKKIDQFTGRAPFSKFCF
jgi:hypothetical protein